MKELVSWIIGLVLLGLIFKFYGWVAFVIIGTLTIIVVQKRNPHYWDV